MAKTGTLKKQEIIAMDKQPVSKLRAGVKTKKHNPNKSLSNVQFVAQAIVQAILENDKEAILEILEGHIKAKNVSQVAKKTGLKRSTIYSAIEKDANPTLDTILSLVHT